jgi:hypothetical protein
MSGLATDSPLIQAQLSFAFSEILLPIEYNPVDLETCFSVPVLGMCD